MADLSGQVFGKLTVISRDYAKGPPKEGRQIHWRCLCQCGNYKVVLAYNLKHGKNTSCGCDVKRKVHNKKPDGESKLNRKVRNTLLGATSRNLVFELSEEETKLLITSPCDYCGDVYEEGVGLDRINNTLGYISGNVISCCKYCNLMKRSMRLQDFNKQITKIYHHSVNGLPKNSVWNKFDLDFYESVVTPPKTTKGLPSPSKKLTDEQVSEIQEIYEPYLQYGKVPNGVSRELSIRFGVHQSAINRAGRFREEYAKKS